MPFLFHIAPSDLWIDLGKMDLEKSGCEYVTVGERQPAVLSLGQSGSTGEGAVPAQTSILLQSFSGL